MRYKLPKQYREGLIVFATPPVNPFNDNFINSDAYIAEETPVEETPADTGADTGADTINSWAVDALNTVWNAANTATAEAARNSAASSLEGLLGTGEDSFKKTFQYFVDQGFNDEEATTQATDFIKSAIDQSDLDANKKAEAYTYLEDAFKPDPAADPTSFEFFMEQFSNTDEGKAILQDMYHGQKEYVSSSLLDELKDQVLEQTSLLDNLLEQSQTNTGLFSPISMTIGGREVSFVPRSARERATFEAGLGQQNVANYATLFGSGYTLDQIIQDASQFERSDQNADQNREANEPGILDYVTGIFSLFQESTMKFMTQGTLRNLPSYLAEDRARRLERQQQEETLKQEAYLAQMNKVAQAFIEQGDFSANGLKNFAETNKLSMPEIKGLMNIAATFKQLEKQRENNIWVRNPDGSQTRKPDVEGLTAAAEPKDPSYVWSRNPDGSQTRVKDEEGVTSAPVPEKPKDPSFVWARDESGKQTRVRDQEGLENYPAAEKDQENKVPDHIKYAVSTLSKSLGYGVQSGWPDKESEQKFNMVMQNVDAIMKDKDPSEINQVLFDTIKMYDSELKAAKVTEAIPKDTVATTVKDAKVVADKAIEAGAKREEVAGELMRKGWKEKDIEKILGISTKELEEMKQKSLPSPSRPLGEDEEITSGSMTVPSSMVEGGEEDGLPFIDTASQLDGEPSEDNPLGL